MIYLLKFGPFVTGRFGQRAMLPPPTPLPTQRRLFRRRRRRRPPTGTVFWWEEVVARVARNDPTVTDLDLYEEYYTKHPLKLSPRAIGDAGALAIADALRVNSVLKTLNLESNDIEISGAEALADALRENSVPARALGQN